MSSKVTDKEIVLPEGWASTFPGPIEEISQDRPTLEIEPRKVMGRISAVLKFYYSSPNVQPTIVCDQWGKWGETDLAAYHRPYNIADGEWDALDLGWLKGKPIGMVLLSNDEGRGLGTGVVLSAEKKADEDKRVLEICFGDARAELSADILILPNSTQQFLPVDPASIRIRCRYKSAKYTVTVFPG